VTLDLAVPQHSVFGEIERLFSLQKQQTAVTTYAERIDRLRRIEQAVLAHRADIHAAMWADYRKPAAEVDLAEIYPIVSEARHARRHLRSWMKPHRVGTRLALLGSTSRVMYEPKGHALILAPWNFPFNLSLGPLVSAIAAGNRVIVKPSEMTPHSTDCIRKLVEELFDESEVAVVDGDFRVGEALLAKRFDHIFFTGSPAVGKIVMKAAAEHLTSVTLELGGKSPAIVDRTANLDEAAKKIAWGKFFNSGQVCIAPDYVLVDESVHDEFLARLRASIDALGHEGSRGILVNERHASRVKRLFDSAVQQGAGVFAGGSFRDRDVAPTVLTGVAADAAVMQEEIFGPVLPVMKYRTLDDALAMIAAKEKPLVLYVFSRARKVVKQILAGTRAGGTAVNHTMIHFYSLDLPFGGVGHSGMGRSHGFAGFEAFSNARGVLDQKLRFSAIELLMPPYRGRFQKWLIDFTIRWL
jgi:aldehyde dehydrogenase (NAD+)